MKVIAYTFFLISVILSIPESTELCLEGHVPSGINPSSLQNEYLRIKNSLCFSCSGDSKPIHLIFIKKSEMTRHGIRLPEWGGGGAIGMDTIVIPIGSITPVPELNIQQTCVHELVHICISRCYGNLKIPRWVHEGLAMALSGEISFEENVAVSKALFTNSLLSFEEIQKVNQFDAYKAQLAYAESHIAIRFLLDTYGYDLIPELLLAVRNERYFKNAGLKVLGLSTDEIEHMVRNHISSRYGFLFLFGDSRLFWFAIALLALIGFLLTFLRNKEKRKLLEEQEPDEDISGNFFDENDNGDLNPETENRHPETENRHPETENRHPETENRHLETENRHPETENRHLETENRHPETENRHPETENRHLETENRHLETENRHLETENRHLETENRHPETENHHPETENHHPETENHHPETENHHPETENHHPETENCHPETENHHPETENCRPEFGKDEGGFTIKPGNY